MFGKSFPLMISGLVSVMAGLLVVNLPETHNRQLPETLEDIEYLRDVNITAIKSLSSQTSKHMNRSETEVKEEERIKLLSDSEI